MPNPFAHSIEWLEETRSVRFELRRHFFLRFFDSDFVSTPGQWRIVAGGALAILISLSLIYSQLYYHKYLILHGLRDSGPFRQAALADVLFVITLAMTLIGIFTTLQWPSLFPGLRDYLALASLPVRMRDVFLARFITLLTFAALFTAATTLLPSVILPFAMAGRYVTTTFPQVPGIFISSSFAAMFVFLSLVAVQGVLLNILPVREFSRISLAVQGILLAVFLCALPLVFSIPNLQRFMNTRPHWVILVPPFWFLGLDQVIAGSSEPLALQLATLSFAGVGAAALAAITAYFWSYRRHRVRVLESSSQETAGSHLPPAVLFDRIIPNSRELAVFAFVAKTLTRSRQHRLILTAFVATAFAILVESFVSVVLGRGMRGISVQNPTFREVIISIPLAVSLFTLSGFYYLFRLPVELRANWVFRLNEHGHRVELLGGVEKFFLYCGALPVTALTLPMEMRLLGVEAGLAASAICFLISITLVEVLLFPFEKIPFTSSYLPGQRPLIETVIRYSVAVTLYVWGLSNIVRLFLQSSAATLGLIALLLAAVWKLRSARLDLKEIGRLEFEELPEPAVQTLSIERD